MGTEHRIQNPAGEDIATIRYNEFAGRWEIDALREPELEFLFNSEEEDGSAKKPFDKASRDNCVMPYFSERFLLRHSLARKLKTLFPFVPRRSCYVSV